MAETTPEIKVVNATELDTDLKSIADAIRAKHGYDINATDGLPKYEFPHDFVDAIDTIKVGSDTDTEQLKGILEGTITELYSEATRMRDTAAGYCEDLTKATLPCVETLTRYAFRSCTALHTVDLGNSSLAKLIINANAFNGATAITALIIRTSSVSTLQNSSAFSGSSIASGTGYIYVPGNLVDGYKEATNWSAYVDQIRAIEDYPEITGGAI